MNNPSPVATDDELATAQSTPVTGNLMLDDNGNGPDFDPDGDSITVLNVNGSPANVGLSVAGSAGGTFIVQSNGAYSFDPGTDFQDLAAGQSRQTTMTYTIVDSDGATNSATVTMTVVGQNDGPVAIGTVPPQFDSDSAVISPLDMSGFFADIDSTLTYTAGSTLPPGLSINAVSGIISGNLTADASATGPYTVTVTADDGNGETAQQTFTWNVTNPAPVATSDGMTSTENGGVAGNVITADNGNGVDLDPDGDAIEVSAVNGVPANVGNFVVGASGGSFQISDDGTLNFDPGTDFDDLAVGQSRTTSVTYTLRDAQGDTNDATVVVTVTGENDAPTAIGTIASQASVDSESILPFDVATFFNDIDTADTLTFSDGGTLPPGLTVDAAGVISGTLTADASAASPYSVTITAQDTQGAVATHTFVWAVTNPAPNAADDVAATGENSTNGGNVLADNGNGVDSDPDGDAISVVSVQSQSTGLPVTGSTGGTFTIQSNGSYTFDPGADFDSLALGETRDTSVTYTIEDAQGATSSATITITVTGANDAPTTAGAIAPQTNIDGETIFPLDISGSFSDADNGSTLTFSDGGTLPAGLTIDSATGLISGTLASNASATSPHVVIITATDEHGSNASNSFVWDGV